MNVSRVVRNLIKYDEKALTTIISDLKTNIHKLNMEVKQIKNKQDSQDHKFHNMDNKFKYNIMPVIQKLSNK